MIVIELTLEYESLSAEEVLSSLDTFFPSVGLKPDDYSQAHEVLEIVNGGSLFLSGERISVDGASIADCRHDPAPNSGTPC